MAHGNTTKVTNGMARLPATSVPFPMAIHRVGWLRYLTTRPHTCEFRMRATRKMPGTAGSKATWIPMNNNRRIFFGHLIEDDGPLASERVLDNGFTFSIRARIPYSGALDNVYAADDLDNAFISRWFHTHPADFNQNSIVDAADFTVWRNTLGSTYDLRADADDGTGTGMPDGVVDQFDYDYWEANFGATQQRVGPWPPDYQRRPGNVQHRAK